MEKEWNSDISIFIKLGNERCKKNTQSREDEDIKYKVIENRQI